MALLRRPAQPWRRERRAGSPGLAPGEALFIPAGWWHLVDALDIHVSVSVLEFAWLDDFS